MGTSSTVYTIAFSPDGTRIAAGCEGGTIHLFETATGELVATLLARDDAFITHLPGGWYASTTPAPIDTRDYRLLVASPSEGPERAWTPLPIGGLSQWLDRPDLVRAALAGERVPPPELPGAAD